MIPQLFRLLTLCIILPAIGCSTTEDTRPNIILMMADDMGFSDIGCYGSEISTPNLDGLANDGLRFLQFYNAARCCPTRASLMTGLYPHQTGVGHMMDDLELPGYRGDLNNQCVTIAEVLQTAGYNTAMSGKWHVTNHVGQWVDNDRTSKHNWPRQRGFDKFYGTIYSGWDFFNPITLTRDNEPVEPEGDRYHYTDATTDNAVQFIDDYGRQDEPFFLYLSYNAPHWPLHAFPEDIAIYKKTYTVGWDSLRKARHQRMIDMGIVQPEWTITPRDPDVKPWNESQNKEWEARRMAVYAAQIEQMDRGIGKVIARLRTLNILDNTLILFLADNGGCAERIGARTSSPTRPQFTRDGRPVRQGNTPDILPGADDTYQSYGKAWANASNTPFRLYKHWVHEGGIATPLIAHWPAGISAKAELTNEPGHLIDIMATCVDVAKAEYPEQYKGVSITPLEGQSLRPVFDTGRRDEQTIFWEHEGNRAVRQREWKLVSRFPGDWELYNMDTDRTEIHNVAEAHPQLVTKMSALWDAYAARSNVEIDWNEILQRRKAQR
jgi:arylsulfatase A-like enzyme